MAKQTTAQPKRDNNGCPMHKEFNFNCGTCNGLFSPKTNTPQPYDAQPYKPKGNPYPNGVDGRIKPDTGIAPTEPSNDTKRVELDIPDGTEIINLTPYEITRETNNVYYGPTAVKGGSYPKPSIATDIDVARTEPSKDYDPIPPDGCNCASFWTIRGKHKADCPLATPPTEPTSANNHPNVTDAKPHVPNGTQPTQPTEKPKASDEFETVVFNELEHAWEGGAYHHEYADVIEEGKAAILAAHRASLEAAVREALEQAARKYCKNGHLRSAENIGTSRQCKICDRNRRKKPT